MDDRKLKLHSSGKGGLINMKVCGLQQLYLHVLRVCTQTYGCLQYVFGSHFFCKYSVV